MSVLVKAPWSMQQVSALWDWQTCGYVHPFTCGQRDDHPEINGDKGVLIPTVRGWVCQCCDYTQDWAHDFMFKPLPPNPMAWAGDPQVVG